MFRCTIQGLCRLRDVKRTWSQWIPALRSLCLTSLICCATLKPRLALVLIRRIALLRHGRWWSARENGRERWLDDLMHSFGRELALHPVWRTMGEKMQQEVTDWAPLAEEDEDETDTEERFFRREFVIRFR